MILKGKIKKLGNIYIYPGSNENEALAETMARVLTGREDYLKWPVKFINPLGQKTMGLPMDE